MFIRDFLLRQVFLAMLLSGNLLVVTPTLAVEMKDDPKGFEGIPWGATCRSRTRSVKWKMRAV